jgi:hypothetical protein
MIKKLLHILTYHDSEPTEIIQGLIWFIFAPAVLMMENPSLWYIGIMSSFIGFGTLYSVVYSSLERRKLFGYLYGIISILFVVIHFYDYDPNTWSHMNWGWVVIAISALSNIRRINQKIASKRQDKIKDDISKMYREDLEDKIKQQQEDNFNLRMENIKLNDRLKDYE